jgi:uracil-DNA glycosylase
MLREEWYSCVKCDLGPQRISTEGQFVFGEGDTGGVLFVDDGPGREEEQVGRPAVGSYGKILRAVIQGLGLTRYYITNVVACRSCTPWTDPSGRPLMRKNFRTGHMELSYRDEPPTPMQMEACRDRLLELVYLIDPVIIVAMGPVAAKSLSGKPMAVLSDEIHGKAIHISIPGAGFRTSRTEKKDVWLRKGKTVSLPVEQAEVRYLCVPTYPLSYVHKKLNDLSANSPFAKFTADVRGAVQAYERYMLELYGVIPTGQSDAPIDLTSEDIHPPQD